MSEKRMEIDLSGIHWKMQKIRPGQGVKEGFHTMPSEYQGTFFNWNAAVVPGDIYSDLQRAGELDDPYFGRNFARAKWVQELEYWYFTKFDAPKEWAGKKVTVRFEGVDYSCEAWLNNQYLGSHEGMFSAFEFDVTDSVRFDEWREGCNILMIRLDPPPRNHGRVAGRKFCFGGDYMPDVIPFGIHRPVKVVATDMIKVGYTRIESSIDGRRADVSFEVELENLSDAAVTADLEITVKGENFESPLTASETVSVSVEPGKQTASVKVPVADAKLWWPWDMGDQHLYEAEIKVSRDGNVSDVSKEVFGIREITMEMNPGFSEDQVEYPWTFVINGKPTFLRSACWGGPPSMLYGRNTNAKYESRLNQVKEANINNLRIFGWHPPEVPYFYELCDRLGITVWTNFSFATQGYIATEEVLGGALSEAAEIVKQRRNHPSTIMWMGGEEVYFSGAHLESDNKLFMDEIGKVVNQHTHVPYAPASPLSAENGQLLGYKPNESAHANEHYYGAGAKPMEEYYPAQDYCVIPELTAASAPSVDALKKFIPEDELWPMGLSWGYHWADIDILKTLNVEVFGDEKTGSLEEFVEATQLAQGIIFQYALEYYRRQKPRLSCVALCHFMTHMPDIKWGIIDYYGDKKLSFDYVKRAYQPVLASVHYEKKRWDAGETFEAELWVVNDLHEELSGAKLNWEIVAGGKTVAEGAVDADIESNSAAAIAPIRWTVEGERFEFFNVNVALMNAAGEMLSENTHPLLIDSQEEGKMKLKAMHQANGKRIEEYGPTYYRYFPEALELD
ncbi:glycoside hydrolase family 2 protein [Pontiella agarivorans]|uniref:beta-mannosidase n=1 Tax=Pontiella agarivorans TaxID=3038953 RepID=A0ABU5MUC1_9BACT|nr:sugar-binding domain-containing protein [Pontiella agarivorans]MDZ8117804.1 glycoside hydrolase family 2 TIM barrel-domain containing protein [Pontiella agarivorans]